MKQILRKGLKEIVVDEVPDPVISPHHVLIRPIYSLISSGTETASIHQEGVLRAVAENPSQIRKIWDAFKSQGPIQTLSEVQAKFSEYAVLGYAGAGIVAEKHPTVTDLEVGDRVAYGGEGTGHGETISAGRNLVARVPDNVPFDRACFTTLGSIALHSVRIANVSLGERVAVVGLGLIGQLVSQLVRAQGGVVLAIDLIPSRVELARQLGCDFGLTGDDVTSQVRTLTNGQGVDCVIIAAAAKSDAPCRLAVDICRDRGRIVDVGAVYLNFPWHETYLKEIQVLMSRAYGPGSYDPAYESEGRDYPLPYVRWTENRNMEEFLRLVSQDRVQTDPLVTHRFVLEDAPRAYETIMDGAANSLAVLVKYPAADSQNPLLDFRPKRRIEVQKKSASTSALNVALVGAGNLAKWTHLPNLRKTSGVRLRAIHSSNGARGKTYAMRFGAEYCASDYDEILLDKDIQAVVIVSRNQHHARQALAALYAGKHVFVEKPMALTEDECRDLARAVAESGKYLSVGFNRRYAPTYRELKKQIARRNGPAVLNCRINSPGISGSYWMADPSIGGAILGEACHFVDLMYWLLESEPVEVSAYSLPLGTKEPIGENNLVAAFRFSDGSIGNLTYCTVGSQNSGGERVEAFVPGAGAVAEDFKHFTTKTGVTKNNSSWFAEKGYADQMRAFFAALRNGRAPEIDVRDGVRATVGCLRMMQSARRHAPCSIALEEFLAL